MGKYTRSKCGGSKAAPAVALGARTRSRSAAVPGAAKRRRQEPEPEPEPSTAARVEADALPDQEGCYLHLRSRKLFMPAAAAVAPWGDLGAEEATTARLAGASGEAAVVGISRCSSAASSTVDVAARETTGGEAEACGSRRDVESSVSDSEREGREWRETTPSSRGPVDSSSDLESSHATDEQKNPKRRRSPGTTAASHLQPRARMPAAAEIDEFFAAAEKAQADRFAAKYNFDVALGVPLDAGRFEWTPVATT